MIAASFLRSSDTSLLTRSESYYVDWLREYQSFDSIDLIIRRYCLIVFAQLEVVQVASILSTSRLA